MTASMGQHVGELVEVRGEFLPFIDLRQVGNASYRRQCRDSYIYTDEDFRFFQLLYRGIAGLLPQKKRSLMLLGPFGVGKSLNLMVTYDLFTSMRNRQVLKNFSNPNLKAQLASLTMEAPFLVVVLMGTKVEGSLQDALVEALLQAMPADVDLASDFSRAAQYLDWLSNPDQRDLKDRFERALRLRNPILDVVALRRGITSHREFLDLFREVYESAIGTPYSRLSATNPSAIYAEAVKELVGKGKPYSGLLVLFDEFGQWVNDRARGEDYPTLTEFAEWVHSCESAFMVMATQTIPQINTADDYNRFQTFFGRCETFNLQREHYEDLIAGALRERGRRKEAVKTHPSWVKLAEIQRAYHPAYGGDAQKAVWGYYPFHPGVIAALRPLADTLGQYERTIFKFVDPTEEQGLGEFLSESTFHENGSLNLLTLDRLFLYFQSEIEQELADTYGRYEEAAHENRSDFLAMRLLRLLVLLHVLGSRAPCASTTANLADLLAESDGANVAEALNRLEDQGHVFIENGTYRLTEAGAITRRQVEARLNQAVRHTGSVSTQDLLTELRNYPEHAATIGEPGRRPGFPISGQVEAQAFLQQYSVHRRFSVDPIGWRDVSSLADDLAKGARTVDPTSVYVVIVTEEENKQGTALNEARKAASRLASAGVCVGVPTTPFQNVGVIRAVQAARALESVRPYSGTRALDIEAKRRLRDLLDALDGFGSVTNFEWYSMLGSPMATPTSIDDLIDRLALHYGAKFPTGVKSVDAVGMQAINAEVVLRLSKPEPFGLGVRKRKPEQIIDQALVPIGLVQVGTRKPTDTEAQGKVAKPDPSIHKESAEIYEVLEQAFSPGRCDSELIGSTVHKLLQPPYWLPRDLSAYYFAAFLTNCEATLELNGRPQVPTQDVLKKLIDTSGKGFDIIVPISLTLSDDERGYLHAVAECIARGIRNPSYNGSLKVPRPAGMLTGSEREQVSADLQAWRLEVGVVANARCEERPETLEAFASELLSVIDQGFKDGYLEEPEFLVRIVPTKLSSNDGLGTLGTRVVTALDNIERLATTPRPAHHMSPARQSSHGASAEEPKTSQTVNIAEQHVQEAPLNLASVQVLLESLEDIRRSIEEGTQGPSFQQLVERMRAAIHDGEEGIET